MTKKAESESRRRLLKQLAAGGGVAVTAKGLPELWTKPVVKSVLLPAHAGTTEQPPPEEICSTVEVQVGVNSIPTAGDAFGVLVVIAGKTLQANTTGVTGPNFSVSASGVALSGTDCTYDFSASGAFNAIPDPDEMSGTFSFTLTCPDGTCSATDVSFVAEGQGTNGADGTFGGTYEGDVSFEVCCSPTVPSAIAP